MRRNPIPTFKGLGMNQPTTPNTENLTKDEPKDGFVLPPMRGTDSLQDAGVTMLSDEEINAMYVHHALTEASNSELNFAREVESTVAARFRAAGRNAQPEQPASPTVAGSVDAPQYRKLLGEVIESGGRGYTRSEADEERWIAANSALIAHINARLTPAALVVAEGLNVADLMCIVRANWGDMTAIEAAFVANLAAHPVAGSPADDNEGAAHDVEGTSAVWERDYAAEPMPASPTDAEIIAACHSVGTDTDPSIYGFPELQVKTNVPGIRNIINALRRAAPVPASEAPKLPNGWVALSMIFDEDMEHPEEVAYGPPAMMERLRKKLDKYYAHIIAKRDAAPVPASEAAKQTLPQSECNAALRAAPAGAGLQPSPMSSAPHDGTEVLAWSVTGKTWHQVYWKTQENGDWAWVPPFPPRWACRWNDSYSQGQHEFSNWLPIPAAPDEFDTKQSPQHHDDVAVDRFADAMKAKMAVSRAKGRAGWDDPAQCSADRLRSMMLDHLAKGDPVDVGNFAMMLFNREESTGMLVEGPRELIRRLYVELFHCHQQMMATTDENDEPMWLPGVTVPTVLADARAALELAARFRAEGGITNDSTTNLAAPAAPTDAKPEREPVTLLTERQASDWAWKQVQRDCGLDKGPIGDSMTYFGFFLHGWNYRAQYERQLPTNPAAQSVRDAALEEAARVCDGLEREKWESTVNVLTNGGRLEFAGPMKCATAIRALIQSPSVRDAAQPPTDAEIVELIKMSESASIDTLRKGMKLAISALAEIAAQSTIASEDVRDAQRFRQAIAQDDNAEALYAAVMSHAPDVDAIRKEFDSAIAATTTTPKD